ncbi:hotdog family protein [Halorientalis regularis]|jgi:acyl dehydratase|uniref:MaoC like domain-containing protein n=1 Tax=Halorientalis regularis TaxID=660518 RepID=A0A1G7TGS7_9EURY|nr:MaoC/PaaZ C-terminal domain-containing protein [Halorientalis regularis]SDG34302.1 MaoC like domain-containing protein [Halorientalis regularis]
MRYFEDIDVGESKTLGTETLSQEAIIDFASEWDSQDYHTDPEAAKESVHGGSIASGPHTVAVAIRE